MMIATADHFLHEAVMPPVESEGFSDPSERFGMPAVSLFLFGDDGPDGVKFPVFSEEVLTAEYVRW